MLNDVKSSCINGFWCETAPEFDFTYFEIKTLKNKLILSNLNTFRNIVRFIFSITTAVPSALVDTNISVILYEKNTHIHKQKYTVFMR